MDDHTLTESMREQFHRVMYWHELILYDMRNTISKTDIPKDLSDDAWNFLDGFPTFLYKWLNGMGSLNWIMSTTPEVVQAKLDFAENNIKQIAKIVGVELNASIETN